MVSMAGYSGTPLVKKLGIKENTAVVLINPPANYRKLLGALPEGVRLLERPARLPAFAHLFAVQKKNLAAQLRAWRKRLADDGTLWVSWPKKSSGVPTDITEDAIRDLALPLGFVDIKICAVDDTWSGLKLVIRKENRKA